MAEQRNGPRPQPDGPPEHLGRTLREIRTRQGLRLKDVAEESELSPSFLSQVEQGQSDISVGRLMRLAQALHVRLTDLVELPPPPKRPFVRAGERVEVPTPTKGLRIWLLAPSQSDRRMYAMATLAKGTVAEAGSYRLPGGNEHFVYLLHGRATLEFVGGESVTMEAGDSVSYMSGDYARMTNLHDGDTTLIWIAFPAES
jgi:transcriptional regulator with XRE-family HTH domain